MNAYTIKAFIIKLERENQALREEVEKLKETIAHLREDTESVCSEESQVHGAMNSRLAEMLEKRADIEENMHKKRAYKNAATIVANLAFEVQSGEDLAQFRGVGKSIIRLVNEYIHG